MPRYRVVRLDFECKRSMIVTTIVHRQTITIKGVVYGSMECER